MATEGSEAKEYVTKHNGLILMLLKTCRETHRAHNLQQPKPTHNCCLQSFAHNARSVCYFLLGNTMIRFNEFVSTTCQLHLRASCSIVLSLRFMETCANFPPQPCAAQSWTVLSTHSYVKKKFNHSWMAIRGTSGTRLLQPGHLQ
jgi:hypothetical protein